MIKWTCEREHQGQNPRGCQGCCHIFVEHERYVTDGDQVLCLPCLVEKVNDYEQAIETFRLNELKLLTPPTLVWTSWGEEGRSVSAPFGGESPYVFLAEKGKDGKWVCVTGQLGEQEYDTLEQFKQACWEYRVQYRIQHVTRLMGDPLLENHTRGTT